MKPLPRLNTDSAPFWEGCQVGELRYQRCEKCGKAQFPPGSVCTSCQNRSLSWHVSKGSGTIHSFTIVERAPSPAFKGDLPYVIALVDIAEGFRMMANVRNSSHDAVAIGGAVRIIFEPTEREEIVLPQVELA